LGPSPSAKTLSLPRSGCSPRDMDVDCTTCVLGNDASETPLLECSMSAQEGRWHGKPILFHVCICSGVLVGGGILSLTHPRGCELSLQVLACVGPDHFGHLRHFLVLNLIPPALHRALPLEAECLWCLLQHRRVDPACHLVDRLERSPALGVIQALPRASREASTNHHQSPLTASSTPQSPHPWNRLHLRSPAWT